jgi:hypothetical protein
MFNRIGQLVYNSHVKLSWPAYSVFDSHKNSFLVFLSNLLLLSQMLLLKIDAI